MNIRAFFYSYSLCVLVFFCNSMPFDSISGNFKKCTSEKCTEIERIYFVSNNCTKNYINGWHVWYVENNKKCYGIVDQNFVINKSLCKFDDEGSLVSSNFSEINDYKKQGIYGFFNDLYDYCYLAYIAITQALAVLFFVLRFKIKSFCKAQKLEKSDNLNNYVSPQQLQSILTSQAQQPVLAQHALAQQQKKQLSTEYIIPKQRSTLSSHDQQQTQNSDTQQPVLFQFAIAQQEQSTLTSQAQQLQSILTSQAQQLELAQHSLAQQHKEPSKSQQQQSMLISLEALGPATINQKPPSCSCHKISTSICKTNKCSCFKNKRKCNAGCHSSKHVYCYNPNE